MTRGLDHIYLTYRSSAESGYDCCAYDPCWHNVCGEGIQIFKWGTF